MPRLLPSLLGALALLLLASTATAQPAANPDPSTLRAIEGQVSQLRGLKPTAEPDLNLLDHTSLNTYLSEQFEQNYLPSERESDQKQLVALGLIQPTDDLVQLELNLLNSQVVGVYDPDTRGMFVVSDQGAFGPVARITYAHEFNHALQDQHFDLNRLAPKHSANNDRSMAVHGLIEGDAMLVQTLWAQQNLTQTELLDLLRTASADTGLSDAPLIIRGELLFPYTDGFNFVRKAYADAGNSFAGVDAVFANLPESTAQVLHPEKYRDHVHPVDVQLPDIAAGLGPDWRSVGGGVFGELDTRILLQQWGATSIQASRVASGWSGDRWQLVERNGSTALLLRSTWSSSDAATSFFTSYTAGLRVRLADAALDDSSAGREALTTPATVTDVRLLGSDVITVIAPDRATADAVVGLVATSPSSAP